MGSAKPRVSVQQALALATAHWGLAAEGPECKALAGYDDANFVITGQLPACHRRRRRSRHRRPLLTSHAACAALLQPRAARPTC